MAQLTLYYKPTCPFCTKVADYMAKNGIEIATKDVKDTKHRDELIRIGKKKQVPCLVIDGKALYESDAIIQWFQNNILKSES